MLGEGIASKKLTRQLGREREGEEIMRGPQFGGLFGGGFWVVFGGEGDKKGGTALSFVSRGRKDRKIEKNTTEEEKNIYFFLLLALDERQRR